MGLTLVVLKELVDPDVPDIDNVLTGPDPNAVAVRMERYATGKPVPKKAAQRCKR